MVRLVMTAFIVEGLQRLAETRTEKTEAGGHGIGSEEAKEESTSASTPKPAIEESSLDRPVVGNPITHDQIIKLWKALKREGMAEYSLEGLLRGSHVYIPPPLPKPEPSNEYKALMARLRHEEEERSYQRMLKQPPRMEAFSQQFPNASAQASAFAEVNRPIRESDNGDDEVTFGDVQKQVMVILNFLLSVIGVAATIWIAARWWSVTARIFLTMGGALVVLVAEVAVYSGYIWRLTEAKTNRKEPKEVRKVMQTWVVGQDEKPEEDNTVLLDIKSEEMDEGIRR
ncbi:hypothetical protein CTRI78_v006251 [Colletotrichum trifolii]|uniref:Vacuolar h+-atpase assembly protein n=1 Tax=Colletotrichum trifolii TaxID=5466 RepID=A0A4R8RCX6_COLTR|nr:hypothetical protein CTRI78_v006251 [Colletotrichum trifolii]